MAHFALIGQRHGHLSRVDWTDGSLSGDPALVAQVQALARAYDGAPVGASFSPSTTTAAEHLASPTSAYTLMQLCFLDQRPDVEGVVPGLGYDDVGTVDGPLPEPANGAQTLVEPPAEDRQVFGHGYNPYRDPHGKFAPGPHAEREGEGGTGGGHGTGDFAALEHAVHTARGRVDEAQRAAHAASERHVEALNVRGHHAQVLEHAEQQAIAEYTRTHGPAMEQLRAEHTRSLASARTANTQAQSEMEAANRAWGAAQAHANALRADLAARGQDYTTSADMRAATAHERDSYDAYRSAYWRAESAREAVATLESQANRLVTSDFVRSDPAVLAARTAWQQADIAVMRANTELGQANAHLDATRQHQAQAERDLYVAQHPTGTPTGLPLRNVTVIYANEAAHQELTSLLGREPTTADVAALVGAQHDDGVRVHIPQGADYLQLDMSGPTIRDEHGDPEAAYHAQRILTRDERGALVLGNEYFRVVDTGAGTGTRIFADQVHGASALGVARIETHAARGAGFNGYYTWPRLGYNAPIPGSLRRGLPAGLQHATSLLDLMDSAEGRAWWKQHGTAVDMQFDLTPGSRSMQELDAYLAQKGSK